MSYLKSLEQEYVIGDIQVFNEFDTSHFISNAKSAITNKVEAVNMNMKFDYYSSMLEKAMNSFSTIKLDKDAIRDFLMKFETLSKLDNNNMMVRDITYNDVISFKPQYLAQFTSMVQIAIDKAIRGDISQEEIVRYISGEIPEKIQRQVVKTTLPYGITSKDLIKYNSTTLVKADTAYVKGKVIPFVSKYDNIKKETMVEANSVLNAIKEAEENVKAMLSTIEKIKVGMTFDKVQVLNQISVNSIRAIIDVISFVSYMLIRKINTTSSNIIACNKLYIDISNMYSSSTMESAFDQCIIPTDIKSLAEQLLEGRADAFITLAENIYDFNTSLPNANNLEDKVDINHINMEVDQHEYDKSVYENIIKSYMEISTGLDVISAEGGDYLLIYEDIIRKSGFSLILEERFQNEIKDIYHINESMDLHRLLAELKDYKENMLSVSNIVLLTYKKLKYLQNRFSDNVNGEYTDFETINEIKIFLGELEEQYKTMTEKVAKGFYDRIKELGITISNLKNKSIEPPVNTVPIETSSNLDFSESYTDFSDKLFDSIIESYEEENRLYFNALQRSYFFERELALRGVKTIFEAEDNNTNNGTTNTATTPNNNNNSSNNQTNNTKVSVVDNNTETPSKSNTNIVSKISEFLQNTIDRFLDYINKSSNKNLKWLSENKNELLNRSYSNVTVNILPYKNIPHNQIIDDISKLKNNIRTLSPQLLNGINSKNDLYSKLFTFIPSGIKEENGSLQDQFKKYYKVGTGELKVQPISNSDLKNEITTVMYPFCESYPTSYKDSLNKAILDLSNEADKVISSFNTANVNESVSIFVEAENTIGLKEKARWISEVVKYFAGSILNAVRDRNSDYLKVLSSLVPKTPQKPVDSNNDKNDNQQTDTNTQA